MPTTTKATQIKAAPKSHSTQTKSHPHFVLSTILAFLLYPLSACLVFLGSQYVIIYPLAYVLKVFGLNTDLLKNPIPLALICAAFYLLACFLLTLYDKHFLYRKSKDLLNLLGLTELPTWTDLGLGLAGFIISFLGAMVLVYLCSAIFPFFNANEAQDVGFNASVTGLNRVFAFFALVVAAPVAEEFIFRGWLYGHLRELPLKKYSIFLSAFLTSLAFAVMHGQLNVGVNVFIMSIAACLLREFTGTIHAGIFLHIIKNWLAFMLIYVLHLV